MQAAVGVGAADRRQQQTEGSRLGATEVEAATDWG